jgi:hypothetical protein
MKRVFVLGGVMLWALLAGRARAQVGSAGPAESPGLSHAWLTVAGEEDLALAHVPPRESDGGEGAHGGVAGLVRMVRPLRETPEALAGVGDRVYAVFGPTDTPGGRIRRVLTSRSLPAGVSGLWTDVPAGVFDVAPALPGDGRLVDLAVSAGGGENGGRAGRLHALMAGDGSLSLLRLENDAWVPVALPFGGVVDPADSALVSFGPGVLLAMREGDTSLGWTLGPEGAWEIARVRDWDRFWSASWRHGFGRGVVVGVAEGAGTGVWTIGEDGAWRVGRLEPMPGGATVVLASSGRLVVVGRKDDGVVHAAEMSLVTGRVLHDGPVRNRAPVSAGEFRLIVGMLLAVMVAALLVIVRPSGEAAWTVPDGFALADPGRRLIATMLDALLMVWVVAPAFGATVREVLTLQVLVIEGHAWMAVPAVMVGGSLAMGVWEGLLGYSPGKFLVGLRVYRGEAGAVRKLGVSWGLVRATIKWMIPPVAALALLDREGRHRGDAAARAVVVRRAETP